MINSEKSIHQGFMTGLDPNPEDIILQDVLVTGQTIIFIKVTACSPEVKAHPDTLPGGPKLNLGHLLGTMSNGLAGGSLLIS